MQLKKTVERPETNEYPSVQSMTHHADDAAKKKVVTLGIGIGAVAAAAVGGWLWLYGPHLPTNIKHSVITKASSHKEATQAAQPKAGKDLSVVTLPEFHKVESTILDVKSPEEKGEEVKDQTKASEKNEDADNIEAITLNPMPVVNKKEILKFFKTTPLIRGLNALWPRLSKRVL